MNARVLWLPLLLLAVDFLLIALHVLAQFGDWPDSRWSIELDGGYGEIWQYVKIVLIVFLLLHVAVRRGSRDRLPCVAWALLFIWLLADDGLQLHERIGGGVARWLTPLLGTHHLAQAIGELVTMLSTAFLLLGWIWWASASAGESWRSWSRYLLLGLISLAFFAVAVDLVHALVRTRVLHALLGMIEEGGEMLCLSILLFVVIAIWRGQKPPPWPPWLRNVSDSRS